MKKLMVIIRENGKIVMSDPAKDIVDARRFVENFGGIMEAGQSIEIVEVK